MTTYPTQQQISELLYKKYLGVPNAFPGSSYLQEIPHNSRNRIINTQVFVETIPDTAPTDLVSVTDFISKNGGGQKFISNQYKYIAYYDKLQLVSVKQDRSYRYNLIKSEENLCNSTIPFNYDTNTSTYNIRVFFKDKTTGVVNPIQIAPNNTVYPWIFDPDVGYLTFYGTASLTNFIPMISFWRYEGKTLRDVSFGNTNNNGGDTFNSNQQLFLTDDTQSTDVDNGALVIKGGVGIGKNLNVGGIFSVKNTVSVSNNGGGADINILSNQLNSFVIKDTDNDYLNISSLSKLIELQQSLKLSKSLYESVVTISSDTLIGDDGCIYRCDSSSGQIQVVLPESSKSAGRNIKLIKVDESSNRVNIVPFGEDTINGTGLIYMESKHDHLKLTCDGFNWYTI
jgi:hypothetical protein